MVTASKIVYRRIQVDGNIYEVARRTPSTYLDRSCRWERVTTSPPERSLSEEAG